MISMKTLLLTFAVCLTACATHAPVSTAPLVIAPPTLTQKVPPIAVLAMNAPQGPHANGWNDFVKYIEPQIDGVSMFCKWSSFEKSTGVYDFSSCDAELANFPASMKKVMILELEGGATPNAIPSYDLPKLQTVSCSGISQFPVIWTTEWQQLTQPAIKAFIAHYNTAGLYYARISFTQYGQSSIPCREQLQALAGSQFQSLWIGAYKIQVEYEAAQHPKFSLEDEVSCIASDCVDYADVMANVDSSLGIGIGSGGAQKSDTTNYPHKPCASDWCALFVKYAGLGHPQMLQTYTQSDNKDAEPTGSLTVLMPFWQAHDVTSAEMYYQDLECAFVPNYSDTSGCHPGVNPTAYQQAIQVARGK